MIKLSNKKMLSLFLSAALLSNLSAFAIEDTPKKFSFFKREKNEVKLEKSKKNKRVEVTEIELPEVIPFKKSQQNFITLSLEECVDYAIAHNPNLAVAEQHIKAAESGIGQQKASFAPRLTARVNYNHLANSGTRIANTHTDSIGFNAGISQLIWDFGKTTARINMAKYDTQSAQFDYDYDILNIVYNVKMNYYNVLRSLANLDIYEQNVRINTLNYERTKAMFDEGLKSKIDVVNAEVNLADSKIQLVDAQNSLATNVLALKNSMYYNESKHFVVQNTENFGFLKADYKKKMQSLDEIKPSGFNLKKNEDGLIMLTSGIEHNDIIQDYELSPYKLTRQEAVDKALENRPDLKSNRMLAKVQEESLKAIKRSYAPELTADLTWGYTKNESTYSSPLQVGASMGLGSINPVGIHYQIKEGEAYLDIANHNVNIAKQDIYWEVQENYINMRQLERKIPLMSQKVKASLENFELADGRYSVGLNNYVELQDALASYNNAQLSFVEAVFEYNVARETLRNSMGILKYE
ncbi:MAG: TolC family protein [Cyanobacteria bacterium SIG31]|nr:TolC family protein [Cyanobacteria bacterium SIG31]